MMERTGGSWATGEVGAGSKCLILSIKVLFGEAKIFGNNILKCVKCY
jgi:hypothetical protein